MKACLLRLAASMQNLSPESMAAILATGLVLGTFPVYGGPTLLCIVAVFAFRVNAPALHLVNQLTSPLQLALVVPYARFGEYLLGNSVTAPASILSRFGVLTLHAVTGWLCLSVPFGILVYITLACLFKRRRPGSFTQLESPA